jgi:putative Holliday junction resolvase
MKILGLDIGEKRIGIAISDELGYTAQGMRVMNRSGLEDDLTVLRELIKETEATEVVMGLPKNMDGSLGESAQKLAAVLILQGYLDSLEHREGGGAKG